MEQVNLTREELPDLVWSEPTQVLARRYGISGVALAKWCQRLRIPKPGRGYWQRKRAKKRLNRPPLPSLPPNQTEVPTSVTLGGEFDRAPEEPTGPVADQKHSPT
jgi:hypothetical protein